MYYHQEAHHVSDDIDMSKNFCFLVSHRCLETRDTCTKATCMLESIYCTNTQLEGQWFTTQCHYKILFSQIFSDIYHISSDVLFARYIKRPRKQGSGTQGLISLWKIQTHNNKSTKKAVSAKLEVCTDTVAMQQPGESSL